MNKSYPGIYRGIVTNITDPEKRGRIKCQIPDVTGVESESAWCEPCIPVAFDGGGDFCVPALKQAVWIMFERGDPNHPVYMGGWWKQDSTPQGANYTGTGRVINYGGVSISFVQGGISVSGSLSCGTVSSGSIKSSGSITASGEVHGSNI